MRRLSGALSLCAIALLAVTTAHAGKDDKGDKKDGPKPVVLHVGDSFLGSGLAQALKPRFEALGARYVAVFKDSSYTTTLPRQIGLTALVAQHKPALTLVTIGANEMAMPQPEDHAHAVRNLTKMVSGSSCVWALPPRWSDKETGFRDVMRREAPPCKVHDPEAIAKSIERGPDKIHPTMKGGALWADHLWAWLLEGKPEGALPWAPPPAPPQ